MEHSYSPVAPYQGRPRHPGPPPSGLSRLAQRAFVTVLASAIVMLLPIIVGHFFPTTPVVQPDASLMPGATYLPLSNCLSLHDGDFRCAVADDITLLYSGASGQIRATTHRARGQTIGDLMLQWGSPDGYRVSSNIIIVTWDRQNTTAYLQTCVLRATTPVWQIEYGAEERHRLAWHGLIGAVNGCRAR